MSGVYQRGRFLRKKGIPKQLSWRPRTGKDRVRTRPNYVDLCCLGPGETTVGLKAVVAQELDVNILTPSGFQALPGLEVQRHEIARIFYDSGGVPHAVRDMVQLYIWKKGEAKMWKQNFYVSTDDAPDSHHQCHVILGTQCIVGRVRDEKGLPIAVTQLGPQSASDKASQEQRKRDKEAALAKKEQERRDREKQQASQKK